MTENLVDVGILLGSASDWPTLEPACPRPGHAPRRGGGRTTGVGTPGSTGRAPVPAQKSLW